MEYNKELRVATEMKRRGYEYIVTCKNKSVKLDSLRVVEAVERIPLRGLFIEKDNNGNMQINMGLNTTKRVITEVMIPMTTQFKLKNNAIILNEKLMYLNKLNSRSKHRTDLLDLVITTFNQSEIEFINNDKVFGRLKSMTVKNIFYYVYGAIAEKKLIAYNNKIKKIS